MKPRRYGRRSALAVLFLSMFVSSIGTTLLLIGASVTYLRDTGLILSSSLVYVAQYLPPVFLASTVARLCERTAPRILLVSVELFSLVVSLGIGVLFDVSYVLVFALLVVRGFLDMTLKACRGVAVKRYLPPERLARGNALLNAGYYLGAAVGSLSGALLIGRLSMAEIAVVDAGTFLVSALIYAGLRPLAPLGATPADRSGAWRRSHRALRGDARLARAFGYLVLSVVLCQGMNQTLRVWLPIEWIGMPASGGAWSETVGLAGVLTGLGAVAAWLSDSGGARRGPLLPAVLFLVTMGFMTATVASHAMVPVFVLYFAFTTGFEIVYTKSFNDMLVLADRADVPFLMSAFYGAGFAGMAVTVVVTSRLGDLFGLPPVLLGVSAVSIVATILLELLARSKRRRGRRMSAAPTADGRTTTRT